MSILSSMDLLFVALHCIKKGVLYKSFSHYKISTYQLFFRHWSQISSTVVFMWGKFQLNKTTFFYTFEFLLFCTKGPFKQNWIIKEFLWFSWRFAYVSSQCKKKIILRIKANRCMYVYIKPSHYNCAIFYPGEKGKDSQFWSVCRLCPFHKISTPIGCPSWVLLAKMWYVQYCLWYYWKSRNIYQRHGIHQWKSNGITNLKLSDFGL